MPTRLKECAFSPSPAVFWQPLFDRLHRLGCLATMLYAECDALPHATADDVLPRLAVQASVSRHGDNPCHWGPCSGVYSVKASPCRPR